ncbi:MULTISPECIES: MobF family relaxase [Micrococcus]|uniref:MobF family relaxase n=1 Tax=Micrococcus TaxID=1269 RepID=UPI0001C5008A|nr:MobF family relaxase [Micrococcus luteus]MCG7421655.1 relaxase domain-containing protein [Micrococcus sp. ACRRV]EFD50296.1 conjugative relaxase domain protein [Micrococcus luteus SK58]MBN6751215.1 relaxase domain-containing protein [Micrococcus luteus]MBN6761330.1 relaxase domain-containing protein [Micrococcus luteus]MBN6767604.1 relaxase domain-containing protein [Micrococcus luteus]
MRGGAVFFRGSSGAAARAYLATDRTATADDYYLEKGELTASRFVFDGAGEMVDSGTLNAEAYQGWVEWVDPSTGEVRGSRRENSVLFLDKVINVDKTLSVAAVLDLRIAQQLDAALEQMAHELMAYAASEMHTRVGPRGGQVWVPVEKLEAVTVAHRTSREGDPHRHLHLQFLNRVWAAGAWRALDTAEFVKHNAAMNRLGEAVLASHAGLQDALAQAGLSFDPATGAVVELAEAAEVMSKRAGQIAERRAQLVAQWEAEHPGQTPGEQILEGLDHLAWAQTRREKVPGELPDEDKWRAEIAATGFVMPSGPRERAVVSWSQVDKSALIRAAVEQLETSRSAWSVADVSAAVSAEFSRTGVTDYPRPVGELVREATEALVAGRCTSIAPDVDPWTAPHHLKVLTTDQVIEAERTLQGLLLAKALEPVTEQVAVAGRTYELGAHQDMDQGLLERIFAESTSTDPDGQPVSLPEGVGHRDALAAISGTHQLVVVTGAAGSGKTTLLKAAKHVGAVKGVEQVIVTPTAKAAEVAAAETGSSASTVHALLRAYGYRWETDKATGVTRWQRLNPGEGDYQGVPEGRRLGPGVQVVVDETGMLSQDVAARLFTVLHETGARAVLTGDYQQLGAVGRGGVLQMAEHATEASVDLDTVHRFLNPVYASLSLAMRARQAPGEQFDLLVEMGLVQVHASQEEANQALAKAWVHGAREGAPPLICAATNENAQQINTAIQQHHTSTGPEAGSGLLVGMDGLPMSEGARIMTRRNDALLGVLNRQVWTIRKIGPTHTKIQDPDGGHRTLHVPNEYLTEHAHLGWALTAHGAQGATVGQAHTLVDEHTDAAGLYVGLTRGRESNVAHFVAEDLAEARAQYVAAMGRDGADHGLDAARQALAAQLEGMNLPGRQAPVQPVLKSAAQLRPGDQIQDGGQLLTVVAVHGQKVTMRPSQDPGSGVRTGTLKAGAQVQVWPAATTFPAPKGQRDQTLMGLGMQLRKAERVAAALTPWNTHREQVGAWVAAHPQACELADTLDVLDERLTQARQQVHEAHQQMHEQHQAQTRQLRAEMEQAKTRAQSAGFFQRRSARAELERARAALFEHQWRTRATLPPEATVELERLTQTREEVFAQYQGLAEDFVTQLPAPQRPPGGLGVQVHTEPVSVWRHLERQPVTATADTAARAEEYQKQAEQLQRRRDWFAQETPEVNASLWGQVKAPTRAPGPAGAAHLVPQRERDTGLER